MSSAHRHRRAGFPWGKTFLIVLGIHGLFGVGLFVLARTQVGQQFAKTYNIKILQPEKPPEEVKPPEPPPPPPVKVEAPIQAPQVAAVAPAGAAAPQISGGMRAGNSWGGKFVGGIEEGPLGAFHASVLGSFRSAYQEPAKQERFGPAVLEVQVAANGQVSSYRLVRSSGSALNDRALLDAAARVQQKGVVPPPEQQARIVTVNFVPY